ncbi:hypothetical protein [Cystobacter ferrugineus]|uniref:hypothetical protein n=1 Tax=Cystobacter ferrugineus TaxID=83449 RepID=UPI001FE5BBE8|nr:hypothetical protein [Cystobacter ferrugineus]
MPLAFLVGWVVSLLTPEPDAAARFPEVRHRMHVGAEADAPPAPTASAAASPGGTTH